MLGMKKVFLSPSYNHMHIREHLSMVRVVSHWERLLPLTEPGTCIKRLNDTVLYLLYSRPIANTSQTCLPL